MLNWTTVVWSMNVGICLTLAGVQLMVWLKSRENWANLFFSLAAVSAGVTAMLELILMHTQTPEAYAKLLHWKYLSVGSITISLVWFIHFYLRGGRVWLVWLYSAWRALTQILDPLIGQGMYFSEITSLHQVPFLNETVVVPIGVPNPWIHFANASNLVFILIALDAGIAAWRRGDRRRAAVISGTIAGAVILAMTLLPMMERGELLVPHPLSLVFLIIVLGVAHELSADLANANQLSLVLQQTQDRMNLAAWAANLGLWEWDIVRDEIWANQIARNRSGVGEKERIDFDRFLQTVHPDDRQATRLAVQRVLENEKDILIEYRGVSPKDEIRWIEILGRLERDAKGKPVLVRGVSLDTTARKQAEIALKESEARLREAQRIASIGNWELDMLTNSLTWSDEVFRIFEIDKEHFGASYETFLAAVHPDDRDLVNSAYKKSLEIHEPYNIIHRLLLPDGRIKYVQERCETYFNPEGKPLRSVGTVQDVTERINVQEERRELRNELAHLNRIMTINELATSLAHEINQPLGAIMNNVAAAKTICSRPEGRSEEIVEILEDVIEDANRASQIVRKVRGVVKKGDSRKAFEILNMNVKVDEVITLLHSTLNLNNIDVHLDKQPNLLPLRGDRVRLEQVIVNLVTNAIEAMKENPEKTLTIRTAMHSPEMIIVSVSNSGPGIDAKIRERLFEPFFSTKQSGLGMGLRICQSIVEEHGGRIWLENSTEDGTTFSFTIKAHQGNAA